MESFTDSIIDPTGNKDESSLSLHSWCLDLNGDDFISLSMKKAQCQGSGIHDQADDGSDVFKTNHWILKDKYPRK